MSEIISTMCSGVGENLDGYPHLKNWLPPDYTYHVCHFKEMPSPGDHTAFEAHIRVQIRTEDQVREWVKASKHSGVTWRVYYTKPRLGKRVLYKVSYKCQHRVHVRSVTANGRRSSKNTFCQAKMFLTLRQCQRSDGKITKCKDPHLPDFPFEVRIDNKHNHNLFDAEALKHRDVGNDAIETLTRLFEVGHSPTSALSVLKHDLQMQYGERYAYASANREICPDLQFVIRLYQTVFRGEYGAQNGPSMLETEQTDSNSNLVEEMMKRLHDLKSDKECGPGLVAMAKQFQRIGDNKAKLTSAMHCFGKSVNPATNRSKAIRRAARRPGPMIACHPTDVARRSNKVGSKRLLTFGHSMKQTSGLEDPQGLGITKSETLW